jgi:hypothetical protein
MTSPALPDALGRFGPYVADPGAWPYAGGTLVQEEARRPNANTSGAKAPPLLEDPGAEPTS